MLSRLPFFLLILLFVSLGIKEGYSQNQKIAEIPFKLNDGHMIIRLSLNEAGPFNFIFDSGAGGTLISERVTDSLGIEASLSRKNVGVSGEHKVGLIKGIELSFDENEIANTNLLTTSTYFEEIDDGSKVHGVVGYAILSRYVVEVNNDRKSLILYDMNNYGYSGQGEELPIYLVQNLPIINGSSGMYNDTSFEGQFMVDTGARSELIISSPTVIQYEMAENIGKYYTVRANIGTSSRRTKMRYGRLKEFAFGSFKFDDIPVALSSDNKGVLSMDFINGIIGNRLLQRFDITFDYNRSVIYFEARNEIKKDYIVNLSGFNLYFVSAKPIIKNLIDRSPADYAGLRNGDEIISINGVLIENLESSEIRNAFTVEGEKIALVIKRNNKFKYTEFKPKPLI